MIGSIEGAVAVVTGAASGIGFALAERFAADGASVVLADLDEARLRRMTGTLADGGADVHAVVTDVTDPASVDALAAATLERFGRVEIVCNNAGALAMGPSWELTLEDWHRVMDVNFWGVVHGIRAFVPVLVEAGRPAHIVNTSSMAGVAALPSLGPYVASKQAVFGVSEALSHELAAVGAPVGVSVLCPGYVPSRLGLPADAEAAEPAPGQPGASDVAARVAEAILDGRFYVFTHEGSTRYVEERAAAIVDGRTAYVVGLPST
ncbi:MAG: SDR family NAD(P)-dependent oxidoreductase [Acidimicrobiales bacterium]|jgi:NAD(P)-dependent dehydrogenase (short-subunit alcohol dehydrogenase family)|nr:SDR family NAD(P)-dependent oxidoreductase [Acidimicrobiales bacterium]